MSVKTKKPLNIFADKDSSEPTQGPEPSMGMIKSYVDVTDRTNASVEADTTPSPDAIVPEEEDEGCSIKRLEDISGIGPAAAAKLRLLGYSVMGLATARPDVVAAEMGVSQTIAKVWCSVARDAALAKMDVYTAEEYDDEQTKKQIHIKTGSSEFNDMLNGGIPTMSITGTSARFSSGKTQIEYDGILDVLANIIVCSNPKCRVKLTSVGEKCKEVDKKGHACDGKGVRAKAALIETEPDTFHLSRLKQIANERGMANIIWSNLYIFPAKQIPTAKAQFLQYKVIQRLLEGTAAKPEVLEKKRPDGTIQVKGQKASPAIPSEPIIFIAIDSMNAKFRDGWSESQNLPLRTRELASHFSLMEYLASTYNVAFYLTHQVIAPVRPEQGLKMKVKFLDEFYPVGGDFILHSVNNWIALASCGGDVEEAYLYDSSYLPKSNCYFRLTSKGLMNAGADIAKKEAAKKASAEKEKVTGPAINISGK
jgi:RecA/RadA recombinase